MASVKWLYDLPRIGPYLRKMKYRKAFRLRPGEAALDLGANVGKVTERMVMEGVKVYAFEPDPNAFKTLETKFRNTPSVVCINKAVSDHSGKARLYFNDKYMEDPVKWSVGSSLLEDKPHMDTSVYRDVEVVDIAEVLEGIKEPLGLIKIDIEGEELKVLNRMLDLRLANKARSIVVETHERFPSLKEPTSELKKRIKKLKLKNIDLDWA